MNSEEIEKVPSLLVFLHSRSKMRKETPSFRTQLNEKHTFATTVALMAYHLQK